MTMSLADAQVRLYHFAAFVFSHLRLYKATVYAYDRVLRIQPKDPAARFHRAWHLMEVSGRREDAVLGFQDLLREHPSASGHYLLGCGLQKESRHEEAVAAFRESIRLEDSRSPDLFFNYALSLEELGRLEEAVDAYRSAAQLAPSDADAWGNLGALLAEIGHRRDAVPCLERAMRLAPSAERALAVVAAFYELHRLDDAERFAREALARDARSTDLKESLAAVVAAQDRYEEALAIAREACAATENAPSSRALLAFVLADAGLLDEALPVARQAVDGAPDDPQVYIALAQVYLEMKDGTSALASFERMGECLAAEANRVALSARVRLLLGRGAALSLLGRQDEAEAAFDEALRIDPEFLECWPDAASRYRGRSTHG